MHISFELLWGVRLGKADPVGPCRFLTEDLEAAMEAEAKGEKLQVRVCVWHTKLNNDPIFTMQTEARRGWTGPQALQALQGLNLKSCSGDSRYESEMAHTGKVLGPRRQ